MRFRETFVAAVQPRHLPANWDVHHAVLRGFGQHSVHSAAAGTGVAEPGGGDGSVAAGAAGGDGTACPAHS